MSFEWQTEEEGSWDAEAQAVPGPTLLPRPNRVLWSGIAVISLLALVLALLLYRRAQVQIERTQATIIEEVLASHELLQKAAGDMTEVKPDQKPEDGGGIASASVGFDAGLGKKSA